MKIQFKIFIITALFLSVLLANPIDNLSLGFAKDKDDNSITGISDRLIRVEEGLKSQSIRQEDLKSELKDDINQLWKLLYANIALTLALIIFVIWDRRASFYSSTQVAKPEPKNEQDEVMMKILKEYAQKDPGMAEVLKFMGII